MLDVFQGNLNGSILFSLLSETAFRLCTGAKALAAGLLQFKELIGIC